MLKQLLILSALFVISMAQDYETICGKEMGHFFKKDPYNCQNYYLCKDGDVKLDSCPKGYLFNESIPLCDFEDKVSCTPQPPIEGEDCPPTGRGSLSIPGDCNNYIFCKNGEGYKLPCDNGTLFDENYRICKDEKLAYCNDCPLEDEGRVVFVPDRKDCRRYFHCKNRVRHLYLCDKKLYFDEETMTCRNTCDGDTPYMCKYADKETRIEYCKL